MITIGKDELAFWMIKAVCSDGVFSESERRFMKDFACKFNLDFDKLCKKVDLFLESTSSEVVELGTECVKGYEFEKYIVKNLCCDNKFKLIRWRGDKAVDGIFAEEDKNPDLLVQDESFMPPFQIFIECKYRSTFGIKPIREWPIRRYCAFSREQHRIVLVAYGCGGQPDAPNSLYLIPANHLLRIPASLESYLCMDNIQNFLHKYIENIITKKKKVNKTR